MSIAQDLKDESVSADKEIFVKHGSFSYLVKNYSSEPSAKDAPIHDDEREWNISVYLDGQEPEFLKTGCRKLNVNTKSDSFFFLKLTTEDDEDVMWVKSCSSEKQPCIKIATGQTKCVTADSAVKISSSVRQDRPKLVTSFDSKLKQIRKRDQKFVEELFSLFAVGFFFVCVLVLASAILKSHKKSPIELKLNLKNGKTLQSDQMFMESVLQMYAVASQFNLTDMQEKCVEFLKDYTEPNNVLQVIKAAHEVQGIEIKEFAKQLLPEDKSILQKYPEWSEISSTFPELKAEFEVETAVVGRSPEEMNVEEVSEKVIDMPGETSEQKSKYFFNIL